MRASTRAACCGAAKVCLEVAPDERPRSNICRLYYLFVFSDSGRCAFMGREMAWKNDEMQMPTVACHCFSLLAELFSALENKVGFTAHVL